MDKLTIDHIESLAACPDVEFVHVTSNPSTRIDVKSMLRQLAQVMLENERLLKHCRKAIEEFDNGMSKYARCQIEMALESNKDTNHIGESHKMVYHSEDMLEMVPDAGNATKDTAEK